MILTGVGLAEAVERDGGKPMVVPILHPLGIGVASAAVDQHHARHGRGGGGVFGKADIGEYPCLTVAVRQTGKADRFDPGVLREGIAFRTETHRRPHGLHALKQRFQFLRLFVSAGGTELRYVQITFHRANILSNTVRQLFRYFTSRSSVRRRDRDRWFTLLRAESVP